MEMGGLISPHTLFFPIVGSSALPIASPGLFPLGHWALTQEQDTLLETVFLDSVSVLTAPDSSLIPFKGVSNLP